MKKKVLSRSNLAIAIVFGLLGLCLGSCEPENNVTDIEEEGCPMLENEEIARQNLIGTWYMSRAFGIQVNFETGEQETFDRSQDSYMEVWEVGENWIEGHNYEMPMGVGSYELKKYQGKMYLLLYEENIDLDSMGALPYTYWIYEMLNLTKDSFVIYQNTLPLDPEYGWEITEIFRHK